MLVAEGLTKAFGGPPVVDGVSFALARGTITGLIGPNGAGKTTLFNLIAASLTPDRGTITLDGRKLTLNINFDGLASAATDAHLCVGVGIGVAGTCGTELAVTKAASGTLTGDVMLNAKELAALPAGRLYIQINSEKAPAPAGNLWGWIMIAHEEVGQDVPQMGHWFLPQYDMPLSVEHGSTHELATDRNS